jgi:hypothetical protein
MKVLPACMSKKEEGRARRECTLYRQWVVFDHVYLTKALSEPLA